MGKDTRIIRKELNALLHELLRKRDKACLRCGKVPYQLSHIYPKGRYRSMEFDPDNVKALCFGCHIGWWHKNPMEAHEWLHKTLPKERLERLKMMSQTTQKIDLNLAKLALLDTLKKYEHQEL